MPFSVCDEQRHGLASTFYISCPFCGHLNKAETSKQHSSGNRGPKAFDINTRVTLGCLHAGIGQSHMNNILSCMNIPTINSNTFKHREREVGKAVEAIAKKSCEEATNVVRNEIMTNTAECSEDNLVSVPCSFDMGWQKRGKGHNSLTGQAAVMSLTTGEVLDYTTRVKVCRFCDYAKRNNAPVKAHDCRKNHTDSSKAMEPSAAVELFNNGPKYNVKYSTYTGDDDSTTEAHIRQKVGYKVEKLSDIVHTKRSLTTRLYNLKQNVRFPNSSTLSQKVINYLVKCFSYAIAQNKGNPEEIKKAIECIVPHAFGDHTKCNISWCGYKSDLINYKHKTLPHGKDLFGESLKKALNNLFNDYCTETVVNKVAPCSNSQRNETLNSVVGSKNPKIRFYGGSDSNDFRVACAVAQRNLRYAYVDKTLEALNIEPGTFCTNYNKRMTTKVNKDKDRKSTMQFKRQRIQKHLSSSAQTARKEAKEGTTYQTGVGLNLNTDTNSTKTNLGKGIPEPEIQVKSEQFKEIENIVPPYTPRPQVKKIKFDKNKNYNFLVFDTETNSTGKLAEICQLSVCDMSGSHMFSEYVLPTHDIDFYASRVNNLEIRTIEGVRKLFKNEISLPSIPFCEALTKLERYISLSIDRAKATLNKPIVTVLIGHNVATFDTPILLRNAGESFVHNLQLMDVWFADSLTLFKELIKCQCPQLKNADGTFPKANQSSLYEALFEESFNAHDSLEDVLALRKILFSSKLELSTRTIVDHSQLVTTNHAVEDMEYLDRRYQNMQTFNEIMFNSRTINGFLTKNIAEKIAGAGLTYKDLNEVYIKYGKDGLIAILSKPPSNSSLSSPRVTRTRRILAAIVDHFTKKIKS